LREEFPAEVLPESVISFLETFDVRVPDERISMKKRSVYLYPDEWEKLSAYHSAEAQAVNVVGDWWFRKAI
jgi:hypothetical protein